MYHPESFAASRAMVVDSEPAILQLVSDILETANTGCVPARSGVEAVNIFERLGQQIRVIISEVEMPGMSGIEMAEEIHLLSPKMPFLFVTGMEKSSFGALIPPGIPWRHLRKPFEPRMLLAQCGQSMNYSHSWGARECARPRLLLAADNFEALNWIYSACGILASEYDLLPPVASADELVREVEHLRPEMVLVNLPKTAAGAIAASRALMIRQPELRMVFIMQSSDPVSMREAMSLGDVGYVLKRRLSRDLPMALREARRAHAFISPELMGPELARLSWAHGAA